MPPLRIPRQPPEAHQQTGSCSTGGLRIYSRWAMQRSSERTIDWWCSIAAGTSKSQSACLHYADLEMGMALSSCEFEAILQTDTKCPVTYAEIRRWDLTKELTIHISRNTGHRKELPPKQWMKYKTWDLVHIDMQSKANTIAESPDS